MQNNAAGQASLDETDTDQTHKKNTGKSSTDVATSSGVYMDSRYKGKQSGSQYSHDVDHNVNRQRRQGSKGRYHSNVGDPSHRSHDLQDDIDRQRRQGTTGRYHRNVDDPGHRSHEHVAGRERQYGSTGRYHRNVEDSSSQSIPVVMNRRETENDTDHDGFEQYVQNGQNASSLVDF